MSFWKSQSFKALQQAWYKRLEEEGFRDAEKIVGNDLELRQRSTYAFRGKDELNRAIREYYYSLLAQKVFENEFRNEIDQLILIWHADGKKIKAICQELEKQGNKRCRNTVAFTIRKYEMQWGIKEYTQRQLNRYGK